MFKFQNPKNSKKSDGFTLVELVVVLVIFVIIIDVTIAIFISIIKQQKRILTEQELLNQTSYLTEYMSRSLRGAKKDTTGSCLKDGVTTYPGYFYLLTHPTATFYQGVKFISRTDDCKEFFLDTDGVFKEKKNSLPPQNILSSKFNIKYSRFIINGNKTLLGASEADSVQPRLTILLDVQSGSLGNQQEKIIQTTVSLRNLNK